MSHPAYVVKMSRNHLGSRASKYQLRELRKAAYHSLAKAKDVEAGCHLRADGYSVYRLEIIKKPVTVLVLGVHIFRFYLKKLLSCKHEFLAYRSRLHSHPCPVITNLIPPST